tara:strand:- start:230 stop:937 length:708 start_codon:yes stop_codon:yes gene_type:complete
MKKNHLLKRYILRLNYLEKEYEACLLIHDEAKQDLESSVRNLHYDLNVFDKNLDAASTTAQSKKQDKSIEENDPDEPDIDAKKHPSWVKKLYRKIMMLTHPDKTSHIKDQDQKKQYQELNLDASEAMKEEDYAKIVMVADELKIQVDKDYQVDFSFFKVKEAKLQEMIDKLKKTIYWTWAHSSEDQREKIIQEFIKNTGWTRPENLRKKSRKKSNHPGKSISWARKPKRKNKNEN